MGDARSGPPAGHPAGHDGPDDGRPLATRAEPDCTEALRELYWFLDGELTSERRQVIGGHLDDCYHCLEAFDFEAELRQLVSRCCAQEPVPEHLRVRIAEALAARGEDVE